MLLRSLVLTATVLAFGEAAAAAPASLVCDVRTFGAVADDNTPDTRAIQAAIDACAGQGGKVSLPKGRWLSGGLDLKSDMVFSLAPGAVLAAIPEIDLYPERTDPSVASDSSEPGDDAYRAYRAFLFAGGAKNLVIEGPGTIDGQGPEFWDPNFYALNTPRPTRPRPQQMMELIDCANVTVRDITLRDAPAYSVRFYRCDGVRAENVTVRNDPRSPNTDGVQIRDTRNAIIRGADINTGDDAIVAKSYDRRVENLIVTDSILVSDDSAIKFGTAGHVGVDNALFENIIIRDSRYGIALFQMDGGAYTNTRFSNLLIETGGRATNHFAIYADIDRRRAASPLGRIEGLTFSGIDIRTGGSVLLSGQPDAPIRDLTLRDIRIRTPESAQDILPTRRKPRGNAFVPLTGMTQDFAKVPSTVTIANTSGLRLTHLDIAHKGAASSRAALALINITDGQSRGVTLRADGPRMAGAVTIVDGGQDVMVDHVSGPRGMQAIARRRVLPDGPQ